MHAKTDSEVTSLEASSPGRSSPRRPVYYVQSPSRYSHDGEKTTTSFHSTPVLSPMGSPPHSNSSVGYHSRESSSSRFSGSLKPGSRSKNDRGTRKGGQKPWNNKGECDVIEEEGLLDEEDTHKSLPRSCYVLAFVVGFFVLFSFFSLILYGASRPQKPVITMKFPSSTHDLNQQLRICCCTFKVGLNPPPESTDSTNSPEQDNLFNGVAGNESSTRDEDYEQLSNPKPRFESP